MTLRLTPSRTGGTFLGEVGKEFLANRGDVTEMDWNDIIVGTVTDKLGGETGWNMVAKAGGGLWNAGVDFNASGGLQTVFGSEKTRTKRK